jgi:hypothetical protein
MTHLYNRRTVIVILMALITSLGCSGITSITCKHCNGSGVHKCFECSAGRALLTSADKLRGISSSKVESDSERRQRDFIADLTSSKKDWCTKCLGEGRLSRCPTCNGSGFNDTANARCERCHGAGGFNILESEN